MRTSANPVFSISAASSRGDGKFCHRSRQIGIRLAVAGNGATDARKNVAEVKAEILAAMRPLAAR